MITEIREHALNKGRARLANHYVKRRSRRFKWERKPTHLVRQGLPWAKEILNHSINDIHQAISITPNVLERLQASYRLTMEQVRTCAPPTTDDGRQPWVKGPWGSQGPGRGFENGFDTSAPVTVGLSGTAPGIRCDFALPLSAASAPTSNFKFSVASLTSVTSDSS